MLKKSKIFSELTKIANKAKCGNVLDIILFGSAARGKTNPEDIDVAIIFKEKIDTSFVQNLNKLFGEKGLNTHISSLVADNFFTKPHSLARSILFEGLSLLNKKRLSDNYGLVPLSVYTYNLTSLEKNKRVRFVYVLKGRNKENGVVERYKGTFLAPGCFIMPVEKDNEILDIFKEWNVKFERK